MWNPLLNTYMQAFHADVEQDCAETEIPGNPEFWQHYDAKLQRCGKQSRKLKSKLLETASRLFLEADENTTQCTFWREGEGGKKCLVFKPYLIDKTRIIAEQRASCLVMHECEDVHIGVEVDFSGLTVWKVLSMSSWATRHNMIDGLRLWSTLPHKIDEIRIVKSEDRMFDVIFSTVMSRVLSRKMQSRIHILHDVLPHGGK